MTFHPKAIPWLVSFGIHCVVLLLLVAFAVVPAARPNRSLAVDISLVGGSRPGSSMAGTGLTRTGAPAATQGGTGDAGNGGSASVADALSTRVSPGGAQPAPDPGALPLPSAQDVLADLASLGPSTPASRTTEAATAHTLSQGAQIGWTGAARKLVRRRDPDFPPLLSAMGQEIEGEARITVAPSGAVIRVEITRSSGYIEIDASVEAALRDYLFSRVDGRENAIGTVRFRFRLEKQD